MSASKKWIYFFGQDSSGNALTEGNSTMREILGGKGANLAEMASLDLPVPPGFTLSTELCNEYYDNNKKHPDNLEAELIANIEKLEKCMDLKFGCSEKPLLVSVRSGAPVSMPGMMDTVLNLGLNDQSVKALGTLFNDERFALDCYRRFIQMYSDVVLGIHSSSFESWLEEFKDNANVENDSDLDASALKKLIEEYKNVVLQETGTHFPQDPQKQLWGSINAVFNSWMNPRAIHYRKIANISDEGGTAVNIQAMVFGNLGNDCATGVAFTRNPSTGKKEFFGEYLINAQGEDVVAGIRTPMPLSIEQNPESKESLELFMPDTYKDLLKIQENLEKHYKDMQDIEFTIQKKRLFILQTRNGKRSTQAAVKIALDMVNEGLLSREEALLKIDPYSIDQLLHPRLDPKAERTAVTRGLPASPGAVSGQVVFQSADAVQLKSAGKNCILVRHETSPEDIQGMDASVGILTALGGMTSHAAVVARGMGKSCVAGCSQLNINYGASLFSIAQEDRALVVKKGDIITLDANTGEVFLGAIPTVSSHLDDDFNQVMQWADEFRRLGVRANADTPSDAKTALQFGAEGIGLCRTEHMFFEPERIDAVRAMILSDGATERGRALESISSMQKNDFIALFQEMQELPVTIRLLDPPLHEFLPHSEKDIKNLAEKLGAPTDKLMRKAEKLREVNPMLGHRGCRLGLSFPEIYEMQARAIAQAMLESSQNTQKLNVEIMIPLVLDQKELHMLKKRIVQVVEEVFSSKPELKTQYKVGTMIEIPRAALKAENIAKSADFFSFGTNDLTQMTMGLSRDDSARFLPEYIDQGIFDVDPFMSIDQEGVGELVKIGIERGKKCKADLKTGVCGEHGGDPRSIEFFHSIGLDYISCSPYRVPTARLSAAQAAIKSTK